jgi:hypothetical protein
MNHKAEVPNAVSIPQIIDFYLSVLEKHEKFSNLIECGNVFKVYNRQIALIGYNKNYTVIKFFNSNNVYQMEEEWYFINNHHFYLLIGCIIDYECIPIKINDSDIKINLIYNFNLSLNK